MINMRVRTATVLSAGERFHSAAALLWVASKISLLLIATLGTLGLWARPFTGNDLVANAFKLPASGQSVGANNQFATMEIGERHGGIPMADHSLWWRFSPAQDAMILVDTTGSEFDTIVAVYRSRGGTIADLTEIASANDIGPRLQAYLKFSARAGVTYYIAVAGTAATEFGEVRLRVEPGGEPDETEPQLTITSPASGVIYTNRVTLRGVVADPPPSASGIRELAVTVNGVPVVDPITFARTWSVPIALNPGRNVIAAVATDIAGNRSAVASIKLWLRTRGPENDLFANAELLDEESETLPWSNRDAGKESGEPHHAGNEGGGSIWWHWKAPADGILFLSTAGSDFDTLLALYFGSELSTLESVASNDDTPSGAGHSELTTAVKEGRTYRIAVDGYGGMSGNVQLRHRFTPAQVHALEIISSRGGGAAPTAGFFPSGASVLLNAQADPYFEFSRWERFDGTVMSHQNPWTVQMDRDLLLLARFVERVFTDDFESGRFEGSLWSDGPGWRWEVQTAHRAHGGFAARSARITHGQLSSLIFTARMLSGQGSFDFKVSSENRWDQLEFFINGERRGAWSGEMEWRRHEFNVSAGINRLEWRYSKDAAISSGLDAAFIDNIDVPMVFSTGLRPQLDWANSAQQPDLELRGEPRQSYILEASSDLRSWRSISTNRANSSGYFLLKNTGLQQGSHRFFRLRVP